MSKIQRVGVLTGGGDRPGLDAGLRAIGGRGIENYNKLRLDALIAIGGDDTLGAAAKLCEKGLHLVGIPKTIDNDVGGTDYTFGFDTAVEIAAEAIDRLPTPRQADPRG